MGVLLRTWPHDLTAGLVVYLGDFSLNFVPCHNGALSCSIRAGSAVEIHRRLPSAETLLDALVILHTTLPES